MDVREFRSDDDDGVMSLHVSLLWRRYLSTDTSSATPNGQKIITCLPTTDDEECKWMLPMNGPRPKSAEMFR